MEFSWNWSASFFKEFAAKAGSFTHREVHKTMRASIPVRSRLTIDVPFGELRLAGCDGPNAELEIRVLSRGAEQAAGISYSTRDRDGETDIRIDGPLAGLANFTTVEVDLKMPRSAPISARCMMGTLRAAEVGPIVARANMGTVEIDGARAGCDVVANLGSVSVKLSPQWRGDRVAIRSNMGSATLVVPRGLTFDPDAVSVRSNMGSARIVSG